jgi:3-methyladenine DNA glycosylase AlkD
VGVRAKATASDRLEDLIEFVQRELEHRADSRKAVAMAAYMKTSMPFYGVAKPDRMQILRELKQRLTIANRKDYERAVLGLWQLPHREEKYLAIDVARSHREFILPESMKLYRRIIEEGGWWDFVDEVAAHLVGNVLLHERPKIAPLMDRWIENDDLWIRRAAIISQLTHKHETDHARLFRYSLAQAAERDFFIRKAIGWALRQYAYTEPDRVRTFITKHRARLSPLTYREASRGLIKQGVMV